MPNPKLKRWLQKGGGGSSKVLFKKRTRRETSTTTTATSRRHVAPEVNPVIVIHDLTGHFMPLRHEFFPNKSVHLSEGTPRASRGEKRRRRIHGGGYCECCGVHYTDLAEHCKTKKHQAFVSNGTNYADLDAFCKSFHFESKRNRTGLYRLLDDSEEETKKTEDSGFQERRSRRPKKRSRLLARLMGDPRSTYMPNQKPVPLSSARSPTLRRPRGSSSLRGVGRGGCARRK